MSKLYLAIYGKQKLFTDLLHNTLERLHKHEILFSTCNECNLLEWLTHEVKLLLIHAPGNESDTIPIIQKVLDKFNHINILVFTANSSELTILVNVYVNRIKVISIFKGYHDLLPSLNEFLPDHTNSVLVERRIIAKHQYIDDGFERIRNNRKKILILLSIADGMKPKEMDGIEGLKRSSISTYIERMMEETGCRNHTELVLQAKERGII